ncbi:MAG: hypothetical protein BWZ10_00825 [candidate division BRC1 bacterium ADurb.BinA364]|nr:MAG: hypothetical protein BWZ10_00825 [candidate division BRC1 bacterium ADurb.BinA364]
MDTLLEWARGPIFRFALAFMILGLVRHVVLTIVEIKRAVRRAGDKNIPYRKLAGATIRWLFPIQKASNRPFASAASVAFHVSILAAPLLLAGHIALIERGFGVSWPAIPNALADLLTLVAIATAILLPLQRLMSGPTRHLSRFRDYALPPIIAIPFVSGFLMMHPSVNPFAYQATALTHFLSASLVFVLIPTTKLSHCALLPATQVISEVAWHFPPDAGAKVGLALGKEGEPV